MSTHNDTISSSSSCATPGGDFRLRWDVFLSFRGEDTRHNITMNIYNSLLKHGVRVFLDDVGLNFGDQITPSLFKAIDNSAASIVVFSPRYADSHWCLEELAKIWECQKLILPVFYQVSPSDVRRQRGPYLEHFRVHEEKFGNDKVLTWKNAMEKIGGIRGVHLWVFNNSEETEKIQSLVKRVLEAISNTPMGVAHHTVGLDSRIEKCMELLDVKSNGIRVLGLNGIGGVGKTTLAKALFNKLVGRFGFHSFISNVREKSTKEDGIISLQNELISCLSPDMAPVTEQNAGISTIKVKLNDKRLLLVLDDVDNVSQVNALIGKREWFYEGSRIIITTRDREVFPDNLVTEWYEVTELNESEALQLFIYHAMKIEPTAKFLDLSKKIVSLTGSLPLAVEVFGSFLFDKRRVEEWEDALNKLKKIRPRSLQGVLKISYEGLDEEEKRIFLDVACLFVRMEMKREYAIDILKGCGYEAELAITNFTAKSLIKINEDNILCMHDQIRDMGRQIVREENVDDPCMRSRLWDRDEILNVFHNDRGSEYIQGIVLDIKRKQRVKDPSGARLSWQNLLRNPNITSAITYLTESYKEYQQEQEERKREVSICSKPLGTMIRLRMLQIDYVNIEGKLKNLPAELKWLQWKGCPLRYLPSNFCPQGLAVLDLSDDGKIERIGDCFGDKVAEKLMVLNLSDCYKLAALPNLSGNQALKKLFLENCKGLVKVHESLGNLNTLLHLNLRGCSNLIKLPTDVSGLKRLENLILSGCWKLKELPENIGSMKCLKELLVDETAIENLPESIFRLTKLEKLNLNRCRLLKRLPQCIGKLHSLKELSLSDTGLEELPDSIGSLANLEKLSVMWCSSLNVLPESIGNLKSLTELFILGSPIKEIPLHVGSLLNLKNLSVGKGHALTKLPDEIGRLDSIVVLEIVETSIRALPDQIGELKLLEKLEMMKCRYLRSLPESIGSLMRLTTLVLYEAQITELPESIGMLENLIMLKLTHCKELYKLPDSIGKLKSLHRLLMFDTGVTELPESIGMLSSLMALLMAKKPPYNSEGTEEPISNSQGKVMLPNSFSNLSLLNEFDARGWKICGKIHDDFEKLSSLEILKLDHNHFCSLPSSLRGLSILKELSLRDCKKLKCLPPLPSCLLEVNIANCTALECISDLSNLESLVELNATNCMKVQDIPGLECLTSLRRLYLSCCSSCHLVIRRRLAKNSLRKIRNLSMPGSRIPDWLSQDVIKVSEHINRAIKGVVIGVVVSLNHQVQDDSRDQLPAIVDIQAKILKLDFPIFTTALNLVGVPSTDEDQVHLCRYPVDHPLVSQLKDGYNIQVTKRDPPRTKGIELKKSGIYLVYEGDDDYEGDEESLPGHQQSISEKLAKFCKSLEEDESASESSGEVTSEIQEIERREQRTSFSACRGCFCFSFLSVIFGFEN
ncbi:disease resistance protein RUN1 [Ziziphus jujuba]|uniref:Disease resistance protein RUN1 n=1 Tax=Ziziphus jujuba TaxID=326968 RepID=A0A6P4BPC5_ZIZJJ|nr:disease resistance protein RUN1 [Ziziphus jujuba]XP_015901000.3 disease resistance protein RUN1 [Ziziphus jujuba]XP_060669619.1 disease resistance protein RUN1 [Ziziphus jujuba]